jgi:hypothetical protein
MLNTNCSPVKQPPLQQQGGLIKMGRTLFTENAYVTNWYLGIGKTVD